VREIAPASYMLKQYVIFIAITAAALSTSQAAIQCNQFEIVLYGRVWQVTSYYVQDDIVLNPNRDFEMLEPDGAAYKQGFLYVSGDREEWSTSSRLAVYSWQNNILTYSGYKQMPSISPNWWGPDGLTFNTSNDPSSYGSGVSDLVSVEADTPAQVGIINISTAAVTGKKPILAAEDITYITSTGKFATVASGIENSTVTIYDKNITVAESNFPVISSTRGLAWVSIDFGQWFSRKEISSGDGFVLTAAKDSVNKVVMYDLAGNQIGTSQQLPITPKARIPLDGGLTMIEPAFGQIEAIAVDEPSSTVFVGDHGNAMIHVLKPIRLAGDADKNGIVNLSDMAVLTANWLLTGCVDPQWCNGADTLHSGNVDFSDFAVIAEQFGESF
jgi:hypothetical protein